jgi:hypothetical protein
MPCACGRIPMSSRSITTSEERRWIAIVGSEARHAGPFVFDTIPLIPFWIGQDWRDEKDGNNTRA